MRGKRREGIKAPNLKHFPEKKTSKLGLLFLRNSKYLIFISLIVALARPQTYTIGEVTDETKGVDIVLAMDISHSMLTKDIYPNRLKILKTMASRFVQQRKTDRFGLVAYAGEAFVKVPLTTEYVVILEEIKALQPSVLEVGTDIGSGLLVATKHLQQSKAKSKVIILMTDGVNTIENAIPLDLAADLAKNKGIKVYTIGIGKSHEEVGLNHIAKTTRGRYFQATSAKVLEKIYQDINQMEKSPIKIEQLYVYKEYFKLFLGFAFFILILDAILRWRIYKIII